MSYFLAPDLSYEALMRLLTQVDRRPLQEIERASLLYDNNTEPVITGAMNSSDVASRKRCWLPVALTSVIVDKIATALYGRGVRRTSGDEELDAILAPTWRDMGRVMLRVSKVASLAKNDVIGIGIRYPGVVKYYDYGAGNSVPILDPEDPHGKPIGVIHEYFSDTRDVDTQVQDSLRGHKTVKHITEVVTRHQRDGAGDIIAPGIHVLFEDGKRVPLADGGYNVLGDFLGCVFWRGADHPDDAHGRSDVIPLIKMLDGLNDLICTAGEKIIWNVHSPIVTNINVEPGSLRYAPGEMWTIAGGLGSGEFFKRLESDPSITPVMELVNFIVNMIHETSRVPSVATGDLEHIGNLSSGRAFEIAMIPMSDLMKEKEAVAREQEIDLMGESIAALAYYGYLPPGWTIPSAYGEWEEPYAARIMEQTNQASIQFEPVSYPVDRSVLISGLVQGVNNGVMSREEAVSALHPGWSADAVQSELDAISEPSGPITV